MDRLKGKVAIITGGAGGIGLATAKRFLQEGAKVFLTDREEGPMKGLAAEVGPESCGYLTGDVTSEAHIQAVVKSAVSTFGGVDVLFANAGTEGKVAPIVETDMENLQKVFDVNVRGAFLCIKHAAPEIEKRGGGSIVITSSVAGVIGSAGLAPYVMSKHAVIGLMRTAATELAKAKIRVNTVNPGPIDNRMMRSIEDQAAPGNGEAVKADFEGLVPLGRYGANEEIANLTLFLASEEASYCTGGVYMADGGFTVG